MVEATETASMDSTSTWMTSLKDSTARSTLTNKAIMNISRDLGSVLAEMEGEASLILTIYSEMRTKNMIMDMMYSRRKETLSLVLIHLVTMTIQWPSDLKMKKTIFSDIQVIIIMIGRITTITMPTTHTTDRCTISIITSINSSVTCITCEWIQRVICILNPLPIPQVNFLFCLTLHCLNFFSS